MKFVLISEIISFPFDEGAKNVVYNLIRQLTAQKSICIISKQGNNTKALNVEKINLNKFFLNNELRLLLKRYSPAIVLYIPEASYTFNSFVRAKILKLMIPKAKIVILGVQHRKHSFLNKKLLSFLLPDTLFLLSKTDKAFFEEIGLRTKVLSPAIEKGKFHETEPEQKGLLRKKYNIPIDKNIVLHVGHIKATRNLESLLTIQKIANMQVVVVGSTTTDIDERLKHTLKSKGVIVINDYLSEVQEIYQLSDVYVFPVVKKDAAIEMPLSILEAMACNLPVVTTRFGGIVEYFDEDEYFKYVENEDDFLTKINAINFDNQCSNRSKVLKFSWENLTNELFRACEGLL